MEAFHKPSNILVERTIRRNLAIETFFFFGEFLFSSALDRMNRIGVKLLDPYITSIGLLISLIRSIMSK